MTQPLPFHFDLDFSGPARVRREPPVAMDAHRSALERAEAAGYERGRIDGAQTAEAKAATGLADEARRLASAAQSMLAVLDGERARIERDATELAAAIAAKLAGALLARHPREAVLAVISECLEPLRQSPHVIVRLAQTDGGPLGEALTRIATENGFAGRLVVAPDPDMSRGDCRIEWADGGIVLDHAATERAVAAAVARHLAGPAGAAVEKG